MPPSCRMPECGLRAAQENGLTPWRRTALSVAVTAIACSLGCAGSHARIEALAGRRLQDELHDRALGEFDLAIFYKPREGSMPELEIDLAPLIIQELAGDGSQSPPADRFGALLTSEAGTLGVDVAQPTVYVSASTAAIDGVEHDQIVFVWFYPSDVAGVDDVKATAQGIRMTLDAEGFPLVFEVLVPDLQFAGHAGLEVLFVSASLERGAADVFGPALPDRRYAVERPIFDAPHTVVVRVIEDGPIPMGPFVYLSANVHGVTTLLCRCSPSQMERVAETTYYDLQPLENLDARRLESLHDLRWMGSADGLGPWAGHQTNPRDRLEERLRWPGLNAETQEADY